MKLHYAVFQRLGLKGVEIARNITKVGVHGTLRKLVYMLFYLMDNQIYDQVSILRSSSKAKLHCAVLLGFGLKETKINLNIMKIGVHSYLPNAHLNL